MMRNAGRKVFRLGLAVSVLACIGAPLTAQEAPAPVIEGIVNLAGAPADTSHVVLHQVSALVSGEIDSVTVGPGGRFSISLPHAPGSQGEGEVFFLSVTYDGILYFGDPIGAAGVGEDPYMIEAYPLETVSGGSIGLAISVRNILLEPTETGWLVTDLFGVENRGMSTLVAPEGERIWEHDLPADAFDFTIGQSDLAPEAMVFDGGKIQLNAALPPGERVFLMRYEVESDVLVMPVNQEVDRFEFLALDPERAISLSGLVEAEPVELDGLTYRRFVAARLAPTVIRVSSRGLLDTHSAIPVLASALALALALVGAFLASRSKGQRQPRNRSEALVHVARLDEAQGTDDRLPHDEYERARRFLIVRLERFS